MTEPMLKTRNVFVDTEAYVRHHFRFDHPTLRKLQELGKYGLLRLLTTDPVVGEVERRIQERVDTAVHALNRFRNEAGFSEPYVDAILKPLFQVPDASLLADAGRKAWQEFLTGGRFERVSTIGLEVKELLNRYLERRPPFSEGKKEEFPDAISVLSLERWFAARADSLYVVSGDTDLKTWCEHTTGVMHISTLKEFLDLYNRAEESLTEVALRIFEREEKRIVELIEEAFLTCTFVYDRDWEATVDDVRITSTRVDDVNVIEIDEVHFVLALETIVNYRADISGSDYGDESYFYSDVSFASCSEVSFEVRYDLTSEAVSEIKDISFDDGSTINVPSVDG